MKLTRNFLSLAAAEALSKLVTFAAFAYLARSTGPEGYGYIEFAGAVMVISLLFVEQGFSPYGAREIARSPETTGALISEIVTVRVALSVVAYIGVVLFAWVIDSPPVLKALILVYGLSVMAAPLLLQWVFQGQDRMPVVSAAQVIRQGIFAAVVFAFVRGPEHLVLVGIAEVVGVFSAAVFCVWMYRRVHREPLARPVITPRLFKEGVTIGLSQLFWITRMSGAVLVLGLVANANEVGLFAGAQRILVAAHAFVWLYFFNLLPSLARTWLSGDERFSRLIDASLRLGAWVAIVAGTIWVIGATATMTVIYGPAYAPGGVTLQLLAGACVAAFFSGHYRFGLIAAGRQMAEMWVSAAGAAAALLFIPLGYSRAGIAGAAGALLLSELVVWAGAWLCGRRMLGVTGHARILALPLFATVVVVVTLLGMPPMGTAPRLIVATALLVGFALALDSYLRDAVLRQTSVVYQRLRQRGGRGLREAT